MSRFPCPATSFRLTGAGYLLAALAAVIPWVPGAAADDDNPLTPHITGTAHDEQYVYFDLEIRRPADMPEITPEQPTWRVRNAGWPRQPRIICAAPAARVFLVIPASDDNHPWSGVARMDPLHFIGRLPRTATPEVTLHYPQAGTAWNTVKLTLDLETAPAREVADLEKAWATALARDFERLAWYTSDAGAPLAYVATRTLQRYDLPPSNALQRPWRDRDAELYNLMTGAVAIQESLQSDRMSTPAAAEQPRDVPLADVTPVQTASHPFDKLRGDREPQFSPLARRVPADFGYLHLQRPANLAKLLDLLGQWGGSLLNLAEPVGRNERVTERLAQQLFFPPHVLADADFNAAVTELAVVASDINFQIGSDLSLLLRTNDTTAVQTILDRLVARCTADQPVAATTQTIGQHEVTVFADPQRQVSCYRVLVDDTWIISNSPAALAALLAANDGQQPNLAEAADFRFMRAVLLPLDETREDGFLYLSDAFIRRLVGPELRIKAARRLAAYTSLKMMTNAALYYRYLNAEAAPSLITLIQRQALRAEDLVDPEHGEFSWDPNAGARNTYWGDLHGLKPLIEVPLDAVTKAEQEAYDEFRERYQDFWRDYFDPIGVRLQLGDTITVDTHILPLIDVSEYDNLKDFSGGEPLQIAISQFDEHTLLRIVAKFNDGVQKAQVLGTLAMMTHTNLTSGWVGDWLTFWIEDTDAFLHLLKSQEEEQRGGPRTGDEAVLDIFDATFVFGVHVKNKLSLASFLVALRAFINETAPNTIVFTPLEPYEGTIILKISPDPSGPVAHEIRQMKSDPNSPAEHADDEPALYYATIGDGFYLSTQADALRRVIDREAQAAEPNAAPPVTVPANMLLYAAPAAADRIRATVEYFFEQQATRISRNNMAQIWYLGECGVLNDLPLDQAAWRYLGYELVCPDGGTYTYLPEAQDVRSSVHGLLTQPEWRDAPPADSPLRQVLDLAQHVIARLQFTEHGIQTTVELQQK